MLPYRGLDQKDFAKSLWHSFPWKLFTRLRAVTDPELAHYIMRSENDAQKIHRICIGYACTVDVQSYEKAGMRFLAGVLIPARYDIDSIVTLII